MGRTVHSLPVRALIVGGGRRGLALAQELIADGDAVRVVTRSEDRHPAIRAVGAEPWPGDPDRVGTLRYALDNVTVLLWLLGTATGPAEKVAALHGSRLEMMLERTVDTTVRGVVYEAAGPLPAEVFASGVREVRRANERNEVPFALLEADPADERSWLVAARASVASLLGSRG
jgi:voltage-gated potassium channel Kch